MEVVKLLCLYGSLAALTSAALPTNLTCPAIYQRNKIDLKDCEVVDSNSTHIACVIYAVANQSAPVQPLQFVMSFRTVFSIQKPLSPGDDNYYCLGIVSSRLSRVDELPKNATNTMKLDSALTGFLVTLNDFLMHVDFYGDAAAGFVRLKEGCDPRRPPLANSCLMELQGASYAVAPGDEDISAWDILMGHMLDLYFSSMDGYLRHLTLSSTLSGQATWLFLLTKTRVGTLDLSNNKFTINDGVLPQVFNNLTYLSTLRMKNCQLTAIHPGNFENTINLQELDISGNKFSRIPRGLQVLRNLTSLSLARSTHDIFTLEDELSDMSSLKSLNLSNLNVLRLERAILPPHLEILDLSYCGLKSLNSYIFNNLNNLSQILLTGNQLRSLHPNIFSSISNTASINLHGNKIKTGQNLVLKVKTLDLSCNEISNLSNIISNGSIYNLDLSYNIIINWTSPILFKSNYYSIINVNLSYNEIPVITSDMIPSLNTLESIDIGRNLFNCQDCQLKSFQNWINTTKINILANGIISPLHCSLPIQQKGELIMNAEYNSTACIKPPVNYLLVAVLPTGVVVTLTLVTALLVYVYRFEVTYISHLIRVRRMRRKDVRTGYKYDVFVSYCGQDREWVLQNLLPQLENSAGYVLCLHERDFRLGSLIVDNIVECMETSATTLLVISTNYLSSKWCQWEVQMCEQRALERDSASCSLVLVELERVARDLLPLHLRVLMTSHTYLEWSGEEASFWCRLRDSLGQPVNQSLDEDDEEESLDEYSDDEPLVPFEALRI